MACATTNLAARGSSTGLGMVTGALSAGTWELLLLLTMLGGMLSPGDIRAQTNALAKAQQAYQHSQAVYQEKPQDTKAAWEFGRACFDLADLASTSSERAHLAEQGIAACKQALTVEPNSAAAHYYLGLDQGELARTRMLGALRLVKEMEVEFSRAAQLDAHLDYAGPDRALGLLYRDAPSFGSIGSRSKAREHLQRALALAPDYPDNRLNLIESELKWNNRKDARTQFRSLEESLPKMRTQFSGADWTTDWTDWDARIEATRKALGEPARLQTPRH